MIVHKCPLTLPSRGSHASCAEDEHGLDSVRCNNLRRSSYEREGGEELDNDSNKQQRYRETQTELRSSATEHHRKVRLAAFG